MRVIIRISSLLVVSLILSTVMLTSADASPGQDDRAKPNDAKAGLPPGANTSRAWEFRWTSSGSGGVEPQWDVEACAGGVTSADTSSTDGFYWGAVQSCTRTFSQELAVRIFRCSWGPEGQYGCDDYVAGRSKLDVVQQLRVQAYSPSCTEGVDYALEVYAIMARNTYLTPPSRWAKWTPSSDEC